MPVRDRGLMLRHWKSQSVVNTKQTKRTYYY